MNDRYKRIIQLFKDNADSNFSINQATDKEIKDAENELEIELPESYRAFQLEFGNFDWGILEVHSVKTPFLGVSNIVGITLSERTECHPNMPTHLIPFSDNGGGDSYCFDTSNYTDKECQVVFWDHTDSKNQKPEVVAKDFLEWIEKEIEWRAEDDSN